MSHVNPILIGFRTTFRMLDARQHERTGSGLADQAWTDLAAGLPALAQRVANGALYGGDIDERIDEIAAHLIAVKVAYARAENLKVDTGEAA